MGRFKDRIDSGKKLAALLSSYKNSTDAIVIGLPRGGVVTAYEVACALQLPLGLIVSRKIGTPGNLELAVGALTQEGSIVWNDDLLKQLGLTVADLSENIEKARKESARRLLLYRNKRPLFDLKNKIVILVDDGIATGATMLAAIASVHKQGVKKIVVAIPVASRSALKKIEKMVDEVVCIFTTPIFLGVGAFYDSFDQTEDKEVIQLMKQSC